MGRLQWLCWTSIKLLFEDFSVENKKFIELLKFCSKDELVQLSNKPYISSRGKASFNTPVSRLGGKRVQDEELVENTYGRTLILLYIPALSEAPSINQVDLFWKLNL